MKIFIQIKILNFLIFLSFFCTAESNFQSSNSTEYWLNTFIEKYTSSLQHHDDELYKSLVISQQEIDSMMQHIQIESPNCITDIEKNLNIQNLANQINKNNYYQNNIDSIIVINQYTIVGCGNVTGYKVNLNCVCKNSDIIHKTLTFITTANGHKLVYDIEKR